MSRTLTIENETHWKSSDVKRIVLAAMEAAGADVTKKRTLRIQHDATTSYRVRMSTNSRHCLVEVYLPKRGPSAPHPNQLIALAAAGLDSAAPILAVQDSFFLANGLAFAFAQKGNLPTVKTLRPAKNSNLPPPWANGTPFIITKYADPAKDSTYKAFVEKGEAKIQGALERVDKWATKAARAQKNLKRARKDLKAAEKSLKDAKQRRGL